MKTETSSQEALTRRQFLLQAAVVGGALATPVSLFGQAALAGNPPSHARYVPEGDGKLLASLGVHEHWNNAKEMKYSRNLGRKDGIELMRTSAN